MAHLCAKYFNNLRANCAWYPVSALALATAFATGGVAEAANECGAPAGSSVTCTAPSYPNGIDYHGSTPLTMTVNTPSGTIGGGGINNVSSDTAIVQGTNVGTVTLTSASAGIDAYVNSATSTGAAMGVLASGSISTSTSRIHGLIIQTSGLGDATAQMTGGSITTDYARSYGLYALSANASTTGTVTSEMSGGSITTTGDSSVGVVATSSGLGLTQAIISGGSISTAADDAYGVISSAGYNAASTAEVLVKMTGGTVSTNGASAHGLFAQHLGSGDAVITMTGGAINMMQTTGNAHALYSSSSGAGDATVNMSGGTIVSTSINTSAILAQAQQGNAHVVISGTASVTSNSTTDPTANQFGVSADSYGPGEALVEMSGGHVEAWRRPVQANVHSTSASSDAVIKFTGGTVISESDYALTTGNFGSGDSIVTMDDSDGPSNITVGQNFAPSPSGCCNAPWGVNASISNGGTGSAYASLSGGLDTATIDVYQKSGEAYGIIAFVNSSVATGSATAVMNGGTITLYGDPAGSLAIGMATYNYGTGDAFAYVNGGKIIVGDHATAGVYVTGGANVLAKMTGGEINVLSSTDNAGIVNNHKSYGLGAIAQSTAEYSNRAEMTGGTINASGYGSIGVLAYNYTSGISEFSLTGGTINMTGDGLAAIGFSDHTTDGYVANIATVTIGPDMVIDASASSFGYALWSADPSGDNNIALTTAGSVAGDAVMGGGSSTFTLSGGSWTGDIYGDFDPDNPIPGLATPVQGADNFIWTGGTLNSGFYGQGGNDTATISVPNSPSFAAAIFDGGEDGGAPESEVSSDSDTITFIGDNDGVVGNNIRHWEKLTVDNNASIAFADSSLTLDGYDGGNVNDMGLASIIGGATLTAGAGLGQSFTLNANLANSGMLSMQDGAYGGNILIAGDYESDGGQLGIDVDYYDLQSDVLTFGGAIGGLTDIVINDIGSRATFGAVLVADTTNATAIDRNEFTLEVANQTASGLYAYSIYYNLTGDPAIGSTPGLYLYADPDQIQPYVPLYEGYQSVLLEMNTLPTMRQRVGKRYWLYDDMAVAPMLTPKDEGYYADPMVAAGPTRATPAFDAVWGRIDGDFSHLDPSSTIVGYDYDLSQFEMQAGVDGLFMDNDNGRLIAGLTAHYVTGEAKFASRHGDSSMHPDGYGIGATATWFSDNGFYTDAQAAATWYLSELKAESLARGVDDTDAFGYALSLEAGRQFGFSNDLIATPQAQLVYSAVDVDSFTGAYSDDITFETGESLTARLGFALERESHWRNDEGLIRKGNIYGIANVYYEFMGETKAQLEGLYDIASELDNWTGEIGFGGAYDWADNGGRLYSIYAEVTASTGFDSGSYGYGGNLGLKVRW
ncbi:autotransporter outer membrane beta-barrel domain-containing protein [Martelella mangrovi]|uniref:Outer membrane autotransporter protein n=1 Tax=Martelella mangrovi TaxID=1397477 RepID=A0ABV2ICL9_9HYPH